MGSNLASIHFRTDDPSLVIDEIKDKYLKKARPLKAAENLYIRSKGLALEVYGEKNLKKRREMIDKITAGRIPTVRSAIVIQNGFVSLYDDDIKLSNYEKLALKYAQQTKAPILALSIYDNSNSTLFTINNGVKTAEGKYFTDYNDIEEIDIVALKKSLCIDIGEDLLKNAFSIAGFSDSKSFDGGDVLYSFLRLIKVPIYISLEWCVSLSELKKIDELQSADVYEVTGSLEYLIK